MRPDRPISSDNLPSTAVWLHFYIRNIYTYTIKIYLDVLGKRTTGHPLSFLPVHRVEVGHCPKGCLHCHSFLSLVFCILMCFWFLFNEIWMRHKPSSSSLMAVTSFYWRFSYDFYMFSSLRLYFCPRQQITWRFKVRNSDLFFPY